MEPVILIVAVTAIISSTYIRSKKINLEKERLHIMALGGERPMEEPPKRKRGFFRRVTQAMPTVPLATKAKDKEVEELRQRIANLETIVIAETEGGLVNGTAHRVKSEIRDISQKLNALES